MQSNQWYCTANIEVETKSTQHTMKTRENRALGQTEQKANARHAMTEDDAMRRAQHRWRRAAGVLDSADGRIDKQNYYQLTGQRRHSIRRDSGRVQIVFDRLSQINSPRRAEITAAAAGKCVALQMLLTQYLLTIKLTLRSSVSVCCVVCSQVMGNSAHLVPSSAFLS
jgi:hypothetical protein